MGCSNSKEGGAAQRAPTPIQVVPRSTPPSDHPKHLDNGSDVHVPLVDDHPPPAAEAKGGSAEVPPAIPAVAGSVTLVSRLSIEADNETDQKRSSTERGTPKTKHGAESEALIDNSQEPIVEVEEVKTPVRSAAMVEQLRSTGRTSSQAWSEEAFDKVERFIPPPSPKSPVKVAVSSRPTQTERTLHAESSTQTSNTRKLSLTKSSVSTTHVSPHAKSKQRSAGVQATVADEKSQSTPLPLSETTATQTLTTATNSQAVMTEAETLPTNEQKSQVESSACQTDVSAAVLEDLHSEATLALEAVERQRNSQAQLSYSVRGAIAELVEAMERVSTSIQEVPDIDAASSSVSQRHVEALTNILSDMNDTVSSALLPVFSDLEGKMQEYDAWMKRRQSRQLTITQAQDVCSIAPCRMSSTSETSQQTDSDDQPSREVVVPAALAEVLPIAAAVELRESSHAPIEASEALQTVGMDGVWSMLLMQCLQRTVFTAAQRMQTLLLLWQCTRKSVDDLPTRSDAEDLADVLPNHGDDYKDLHKYIVDVFEADLSSLRSKKSKKKKDDQMFFDFELLAALYRNAYGARIGTGGLAELSDSDDEKGESAEGDDDVVVLDVNVEVMHPVDVVVRHMDHTDTMGVRYSGLAAKHAFNLWKTHRDLEVPQRVTCGIGATAHLCCPAAADSHTHPTLSASGVKLARHLFVQRALLHTIDAFVQRCTGGVSHTHAKELLALLGTKVPVDVWELVCACADDVTGFRYNEAADHSPYNATGCAVEVVKVLLRVVQALFLMFSHDLDLPTVSRTRSGRRSLSLHRSLRALFVSAAALHSLPPTVSLSQWYRHIAISLARPSDPVDDIQWWKMFSETFRCISKAARNPNSSVSASLSLSLSGTYWVDDANTLGRSDHQAARMAVLVLAKKCTGPTEEREWKALADEIGSGGGKERERERESSATSPPALTDSTSSLHAEYETWDQLLRPRDYAELLNMLQLPALWDVCELATPDSSTFWTVIDACTRCLQDGKATAYPDLSPEIAVAVARYVLGRTFEAFRGLGGDHSATNMYCEAVVGVTRAAISSAVSYAQDSGSCAAAVVSIVSHTVEILLLLKELRPHRCLAFLLMDGMTMLAHLSWCLSRSSEPDDAPAETSGTGRTVVQRVAELANWCCGCGADVGLLTAFSRPDAKVPGQLEVLRWEVEHARLSDWRAYSTAPTILRILVLARWITRVEKSLADSPAAPNSSADSKTVDAYRQSLVKLLLGVLEDVRSGSVGSICLVERDLFVGSGVATPVSSLLFSLFERLADDILLADEERETSMHSVVCGRVLFHLCTMLNDELLVNALFVHAELLRKVLHVVHSVVECDLLRIANDPAAHNLLAGRGGLTDVLAVDAALALKVLQSFGDLRPIGAHLDAFAELYLPFLQYMGRSRDYETLWSVVSESLASSSTSTTRGPRKVLGVSATRRTSTIGSNGPNGKPSNGKSPAKPHSTVDEVALFSHAREYLPDDPGRTTLSLVRCGASSAKMSGVVAVVKALLHTSPYLVPIACKAFAFYAQYGIAKVVGGDRSNVDVLQISRQRVLSSAFTQFMERSKQKLQKMQWKVEFTGEVGIDIQGLRREFITLLCKELTTTTDQTGSSTVLFISTSENDLIPNPAAASRTHLRQFEFVGRFLGKCLLEREVVALPLSTVVWKHILRRPLTAYDLALWDPVFYRHHIQYIRKNNMDSDEIQDILGYLRFTVTSSTGTEVPLCANGEEKRVTEANKNEYLDMVIEYKLMSELRPQLQALVKGFTDIVPLTALQGVYHEYELRHLLCGDDVVDISDWKAHTKYTFGYDASSLSVKLFWEAVESFSTAEQRAVLQFITGAPRVPSSGFRDLQPHFTIQRIPEASSEHLPSASTCFNLLKWPEYSELAVVQKDLLYVSSEGKEGFGFS